jgi:hypothetical protein
LLPATLDLIAEYNKDPRIQPFLKLTKLFDPVAAGDYSVPQEMKPDKESSEYKVSHPKSDHSSVLDSKLPSDTQNRELASETSVEPDKVDDKKSIRVKVNDVKESQPKTPPPTGCSAFTSSSVFFPLDPKQPINVQPQIESEKPGLTVDQLKTGFGDAP